MVRINSEAAQTNGAEFLVANGDRIRRAPVLIGLGAGREKVDIGFERRLERFVPVHDVGKDRERLRVERIEAGAKRVGGFAFVDEERVLRVAHSELSAILDFAVLHRVAIRENAVFGFDPIDDVDKLF